MILFAVLLELAREMVFFSTFPLATTLIHVNDYVKVRNYAHIIDR